jgi:hypothetical protein
MLSNRQLAARKFREKQRRARMLEVRLDRQVARAEAFKRGATRKKWLAMAEKTRQELRETDH